MSEIDTSWWKRTRNPFVLIDSYLVVGRICWASLQYDQTSCCPPFMDRTSIICFPGKTALCVCVCVYVETNALCNKCFISSYPFCPSYGQGLCQASVDIYFSFSSNKIHVSRIFIPTLDCKSDKCYHRCTSFWVQHQQKYSVNHLSNEKIHDRLGMCYEKVKGQWKNPESKLDDRN